MENQQTVPVPGARIRQFFESGSYRPWFAAAAICIVLLGAWARFSLPQIPVTNKDSGGYISPALALLVKGAYEPSHRNFPYAGFVWILLRTTGTYVSITVAQHLLGLAGGLVTWLAWLRLRIFFPSDWRISAAHAVFGLLLVWGLLLSAYPIFFEHSMRPEAIYPFLIGLHLYGAAAFLDRSLVRRSPPLAIWWGSLMTFVSIGLYVLKPIWGLALISGGLPLLIVFVCARGKWRLIPFAAGAAGLLAGLALFVVPESALSSSRPQPVSLINQQLFFVHADLIERELRHDLAGPGTPPFPREILLATADELRAGLTGKCRKPYRTLGFNPDDFMYGKADDQVMQFFWRQPGGADRFYGHYYVRAWLRQPFQMLRKILREFVIFYRFDGKVTRAGSTLELKTNYEDSADIFNNPDYLKNYRAWKPMKDYEEAVRGVRTSDQPYKVDLMTAFLNVVDVTYLVSLLLFLAAGFRWGRKGDPQTGGIPPLWLGLWLFGYNFGITLTVALVHSMSIKRYTDTQFSLTLFSFFAGLLILLSVLLGVIRAVPEAEKQQA